MTQLPNIKSFQGETGAVRPKIVLARNETDPIVQLYMSMSSMELVYERKHYSTSADLLRSKFDLCPDPSISLTLD